MPREFLSALVVFALLFASPSLPAEDAHRIAPGPFVVRVTSEQGNAPLAGLLVRLGGRYATTALDGSATFDGVPAGAYKVVIEAIDFERVEREIQLPAGRRDPIAVSLRPVAQVAVHGVVTIEDGRPLAGARISLVPVAVPAAVQGPFQLAAGWDGKFSVIQAPPGRYQARVSAPGCASKTFDMEVSPGMPEVHFDLVREGAPADLRVTVQDSSSGKAIEGARVTLAEAWPKGWIAEATTSAGGEATLGGLRLGRLNWMDAKGKVEIAHRASTVRVEAEGFEPAVVPVSLDEGARLSVSLHSTEKIMEREPNEDLASAQEIHTGAPVELAIEKAGDHDCFRFRLAYPARTRIRVRPNAALTLWVFLFGSDGRERARWAVSPKDTQDLDAGALAAGTYFLQVREYNDGAFDPSPVTVTVACDWAADPNEPNDSLSTARLLVSGEEARGYLFPAGDHDHYRFEVKRPGHVRVTTPAHPLTRWIFLLDGDGKEVSRATVSPGGGEFGAAVTPGTYTLQTREYNDSGVSTEPYSLRLEEIDDDGIGDSRPNGAGLRGARLLPLNSQAAATILPPGDQDWYSVPVPCAGRVHGFVTAPAEYTIWLFLHDGAGHELGRAAASPGQTGTATWDASGPTTLYLMVRGYNNSESAPSPYVVRATFEPCDELEAMDRNDSAETATPLELGEWVRANLMPSGDMDWYRVWVDCPGFLRVERQTPPLTIWTFVFDAKQRELARWAHGPNEAAVEEVPVLAGEHFIRVSEYNNSGAHSCPYSLRVTLRRAEPQERVPMHEDPVRPLKAGEAQAFWIDQAHDHDRFLFETTAAGKCWIRMRLPDMTSWLFLFDDRTGAELRREAKSPDQELRWEVESKGPTRYRLEAREYNDSGVSPSPGYILADTQDRPFAAERVRASADPLDPTRITFTREAIPGYAAATAIRIDADGDGKPDLDLNAATTEWRAPAEGLYTATAWLEGAGGVTTKVALWVEATGPQERKGVRLYVDHPSEGQVVETDAPVRARAMSYSGARVTKVAASVDGRGIASSYAPPHEIEIPWRTLGPGDHVLEVKATDARGADATLKRTFRVSQYFDLQPQDGAAVTGNDVRIGWAGGDHAQTRVRYRVKGSNDWKEVEGESGLDHAVRLTDLEAGKAYEFQPVGAGEPGPIRTVTRVKGLAFGQARYGGSIARDYDQRIPVSVQNHGEKPLTVRLECGKPEADLLVGFVGEGSEGAPFNLGPGEDRAFLLCLSAQDAKRPSYRFPIRLASEAGFTDESEVEVSVKLPQVKLEWEPAGAAPDGLGQVFHLHNRGDALTDLDVASDNPEVILSPSIRHGLLPAGATVDVVAQPLLHEGFQAAEAGLHARAVDKESAGKVRIAVPEGKSIFGVSLLPGIDPREKETTHEQDILAARQMAGAWLNPDSVDWSKRTDPEDTDGDGRPDRWRVDDTVNRILWVGDDTDGDGEIDFVHADIGYAGQFEYSAFRGKGGWEPTNLVDAWLDVGFKLPWARNVYEKHDVDIVVNGVVVGKLREAIPEGNYSFRIPPTAIRFNDAGVPEGNAVEVQSKHLRGGHYVVSSDFRIRVRMTGATGWVVADSREQAAEKIVQEQGLSLDGPEYSVSSSELRIDGPPLAPGADVFVVAPIRNLGAAASSGVTVALVRSAPGGEGIEVSRVRVPEVPLSGAVSVRLPWKAGAGTHALRVVVDPDNEAQSKNRDNNGAMISVTVPGDASKPVLSSVEPASGTTVEDTLVPVRTEAKDDNGVARVDLRIDQGLWEPLDDAGKGAFAGKVLLQPGGHTLTIRATNTSGNTVEQAVQVTVKAGLPEGKIIRPTEGTKVNARRVEVGAEAAEGAQLVAFRVNGGPWKRVAVEKGGAATDVALAFGHNAIEAMIVNGRGAQRILGVGVECTLQPDPAKKEGEKEDQKEPGQEPVAKDGAVQVDGVGPVDAFQPPNQVVGGKGRSKKPEDVGYYPPPATDNPVPVQGIEPAAPEDPAWTPGDFMPTELQPDTLPPVIDTPEAPAGPSDAQQHGTGETPAPTPTDGAARPTGASRPPGGYITAQVKQSDWYCTNRPNIKVPFRLPEWLKKLKLQYANREEYDRMVTKLLTTMQMQGIKTGDLEKLQDMIRRKIRGIDQPGELPGFLESLGMGQPPKDDPEALRKWRANLEQAADAWYLRLLASGDPHLVAEGLKARAEALGQFDHAMQEQAEAAVQTIEANQKLVENVAQAVPMVGNVLDIYAFATGEGALSGERLSALERTLRLACVLGPMGIEELIKRSPSAQLVLQGLGEMGQGMGKSGREMLAHAMGKDVGEIEKGFAALAKKAEWLTKERSLFGKDLEAEAEAARKAFAKSPEGIADATRTMKDRAEAMDVINRVKNAESPEELRQAVLELQGNKTAQGLINGKGIPDEVRQAVNKEIKGMYDAADKGTGGAIEDLFKTKRTPQALEDAAKALGMEAKDAKKLQEQVEALAKKHGVDASELEVGPMTVTNSRPLKPGETPMTSVGRDRDVTYVIKTKDGKVLGDIDHAVSKGPYEQEFWKASKGSELPRRPDGSIDVEAIAAHAQKMDQTVTSAKHLEAYNTGEVSLNDFLDKGKQPTITRIEDVRDTVTHKSEEWFDRAAHETDPVMASRNSAEGMRQATKQYDDLVMSRVKQYGLGPENVPERLRTGIDVFKKVKDGAITPKQAEAMLSAIGTSKEGLVKDMGSFLEGLEKTTGVGFRQVKAAELLSSLHKIPGKGTDAWANQSLKSINDALAHGHITGEQIRKLHSEVFAGRLQAAKAANPSAWKQDMVQWAHGAENQHLLGAWEEEALKSE